MGRQVAVGPVTLGNDLPLALIAGPCQLEGLDHALRIADSLAAACDAAGIGLIFKASFDKANRTSLDGKRGPGLEAGLEMLAQVKARSGLPVLTDIHAPEQAAPVAQVADVLQIPAFLCRQTDLLVAAAKTGAVVNVKKGQFLAPWDMAAVAQKVSGSGNDNILLTERGASFGYNTLVADMRALPIMAGLGYPVVMDATHAVQAPGGQGAASGGDRRMAPVLARAAAAVGVAGIFLETHPDPDAAPSDGPNMIRLSDMPALIQTLAALDTIAKSAPIQIT
ncbi:MAG: 3-deoxy-8-phosphooctulonate synthase [Rhodobacterales bacterium]|nr:MAG: 3-deoxy-8-phosphooctulonate synthase [Rhodobacterales bacterium]PIE12394.1 MAG: 3-deoxy-8-phosphooctulonate synthase [Rhodobacterales bacterium]